MTDRSGRRARVPAVVLAAALAAVAAFAPASRAAPAAPPPSLAAASRDLFGVVALAPFAPPTLAMPARRRLLPVVAVRATYGVTPPRTAVAAGASLPVAGAPRRQRAYALRLAGGVLYLVGPWPARARATVGADGSFGLTVRGRGQTLSVFSDSACVGCALGAGAPYFWPLAGALHRQYGAPRPRTLAVDRLRAWLTVRYPQARVATFGMRVAGGQVALGFVDAAMRYDRLGGLVFGATWTGPAALAGVGAAELAVVRASLDGGGRPRG